jgi:hypothetical protein
LRRRVTLVDGKQLAAVLRIKVLWRQHCCALAVFCRRKFQFLPQI